MLEINNLFVGFNMDEASKKIVLDGFNLKVNKGDFIVVLGSNGCGKSTLFNAILGNVSYTGDILLNNKSLNNMKTYKRCANIGVVFQDPLRGTASNLKVIDNIMLAGNYKNFIFNKKNIVSNVKNELSIYGMNLTNQLNLKASELSGGQRQALTLYMATNKNIDLLLLDEHTAALDPNSQVKIMELTEKIVSSKNITTLMITHNLHDALRYGNRLIILNKGKVVLDASNKEKESLKEDEILKLYN